MKKIGIITFHRAHNYGAVLQAYALQKVLSENNEVKIIDFRNKAIENAYKLFKINKKNVFSIGKSLLGDILYFPRDKKRYDCFNKFINANFHMTEKYNNYEQLKKEFPKFDIYITGSDQVWNYEISQEVNAYTLNFGDSNIKKISYAASIGEDTFNQKYINQFVDNIKKLNFVSIRESQTRMYLENLIGREVAVTMDPTLLRTVEEWNNDLKDIKNIVSEKYIFAYVVEENEEFYKILNYLSEITGYKIIHTGRRNKNVKSVLKSAYTNGPFEFVNLIKNAEYVVATSFHATVFSVLYHKKFWIVPHLKTGGRVRSLLKKLNISNRAVTNFQEFKKKDYDEQINYNKVDEILRLEREKSKKWLNNAIKN